jgi:hypothetical protein
MTIPFLYNTILQQSGEFVGLLTGDAKTSVRKICRYLPLSIISSNDYQCSLAIPSEGPLAFRPPIARSLALVRNFIFMIIAGVVNIKIRLYWPESFACEIQSTDLSSSQAGLCQRALVMPSRGARACNLAVKKMETTDTARYVPKVTCNCPGRPATPACQS